MSQSSLTAQELKQHTLKVYEPFSEFLQGSDEEHHFEISLLDVVRFAGHACPSMVGAFLITQQAIAALYPETKTCVRGDLAVDLPKAPTDGATGPMANVFSFITGAWAETGFGGLQGQFSRRGLLNFNVKDVPQGGFRFTRLSTGQSVDVFYDPSRANVAADSSLHFQQQWRRKISGILQNPSECVQASLSVATQKGN